jgi:hypothetical protein
MKRHELTITDILHALGTPEALPERIDETGAVVPTPVRDRVEGKEALLRALAGEKALLIVCVGCGAETPLAKSALCVCGGFVCPACVVAEEEGCDHIADAFDD